MAISSVQTTRESWALSRQNGKFLRVVTANTARQVLGREQAKGTFPKATNDYTTWVDRHPGKREVQVRFGGKISYIRKQALAEVYTFVIREIMRLSPVGDLPKRGKEAFRRRHYRDSHIMVVDGKATVDLNATMNIQLDRFGPAGVQAMKKVWFMNIQPYARRIERGAHGQKTIKYSTRVQRGRNKGKLSHKRGFWSMQAPSGVYRIVAKRAAIRFRGVARIQFGYRQLPAVGYKVQDPKGSFFQVYPTIIVRPDTGGIV